MRYDRHRDQIIVSRVAPVEFVSIERCDIDIALDLRVSADYVRIGPRHLGDFVIVHSDVENFPHVLAVMGVHNPLGKVTVEHGHNRGVGLCQLIMLFLMFIGPIYEGGNLGVQVFCGLPYFHRLDIRNHFAFGTGVGGFGLLGIVLILFFGGVARYCRHQILEQERVLQLETGVVVNCEEQEVIIFVVRIKIGRVSDRGPEIVVALVVRPHLKNHTAFCHCSHYAFSKCLQFGGGDNDNAGLVYIGRY